MYRNEANIKSVSYTHLAETLEEVVVVGYGTMKKSDLTGSVTSVNAEEMCIRDRLKGLVM